MKRSKITMSGEDSAASDGIMLFGVRITEGQPATTSSSSFRKSVSMYNLSQLDQPQDPIMNADVAAEGYDSDDVVHAASGRSCDRKRGVPWTEEEHRSFLLGLQKVGKGDWKGISRNFVKSRTPTQVASHAQKYFLRRTNQSRRRRRSSLFDITTDTVTNSSMEEDEAPVHQEPMKLTLPLAKSQSSNNLVGFSISPFPMTSLSSSVLPPAAAASTSASDHDHSLENLTLGPSPKNLIRPIPIPPPSFKMAELNLNHTSPTEPLHPLSLRLSTPSSEGQPPAPPAAATNSHSSSFQSMSSGDSIISVA